MIPSRRVGLQTALQIDVAHLEKRRGSVQRVEQQRELL